MCLIVKYTIITISLSYLNIIIDPCVWRFTWCFISSLVVNHANCAYWLWKYPHQNTTFICSATHEVVRNFPNFIFPSCSLYQVVRIIKISKDLFSILSLAQIWKSGSQRFVFVVVLFRCCYCFVLFVLGIFIAVMLLLFLNFPLTFK